MAIQVKKLQEAIIVIKKHVDAKEDTITFIVKLTIAKKVLYTLFFYFMLLIFINRILLMLKSQKLEK